MQSEVQGEGPILSSREALIGMLLMLDHSVTFSEETLRKFLREQSQWRPEFENLFRTRKTECGDKGDGLDNLLFYLLDLLLVETGQGFRVRRIMRDTVMEQFKVAGILPRHEQRFRQDAERFAAAVKQTQS